MLTQEIIAELQKRQYKTFFAGIFSADNIPKKIKHKHFIILNTDFKDGPGKHWYVVVRLHNLLECFDPLGVSEDRKHFISTNLKFAGIHHISFKHKFNLQFQFYVGNLFCFISLNDTITLIKI
ncbi:MAG: hypothetical protein FJ333_00830 [Sphingomonadales bacterium]|nr:hypothetical protein [Sphingomonadales bacterium]